MPTEVLDIVDTAVKIGLGAAITGFTTYVLTKLKHGEETARERRQRKCELIENAVDAADGYILALGNFFAVLDGLRKDFPQAKTVEESGEETSVEEYERALLDSVLQRVRAYSRLKIIGETKAAESLHKLHELEDEIRQHVIFKRELPDSKKLDDWYYRFRESRDAFLSELSKNY